MRYDGANAELIVSGVSKDNQIAGDVVVTKSKTLDIENEEGLVRK